MGERGKVWRKVWAEAKDLGKKLIFPTLVGVAATLVPLEEGKLGGVNKLGAEPSKEDTVYLPGAKIDSAFAWKYGKVQEVDSIVLEAVYDSFRIRNWHDHIFVDVGDGWTVRVCGNGIGFYRDGKSVGGFTAGDSWDEVIAELKSDRVRIIKYTDEYGNNVLIGKQDSKTVNIWYAGWSGQGLIWIRDRNSPFTIGRIGVLLTDEGDLGKAVTVLTEIKNDGIAAVSILPSKKLISSEWRVEVASR
ncbi:MAG: hypothetical protein QXD51_01595 [Candidatus Anstonellales archaeon]